MKLQEAIKLMKQGAFIRRPIFMENNYLFIKNHIIMNKIPLEKAYFTEDHFDADDWYVYKDNTVLSSLPLTTTNLSLKLNEFLNYLEDNYDVGTVRHGAKRYFGTFVRER